MLLVQPGVGSYVNNLPNYAYVSHITSRHYLLLTTLLFSESSKTTPLLGVFR